MKATRHVRSGKPEVRRVVPVLVLMGLLARPAGAQSLSPEMFLHGVPTDAATSAPLTLTLADAIQRGLAHNLGALTAAQEVRSADGGRWKSLSELLPHAGASVREADQVVNLAAFGFTGFPGIPKIVGPFGVFDARVAVSAPILDLSAVDDVRADSATLDAERHSYRDAQQLVAQVVADLYFEAVADASRVASFETQAATAQTLYELAHDQKSAGVVAGIDVVRQQVQLQEAKQRVIAAQNALEKQRLKLARAVGIPAEQPISLSNALSYTPAAAMTLEAATAQAEASRDDLKSAEARADSARAARDAAQAGALPTVHLDADYGAIGSRLSDAKRTYTVVGTLRVPLFQGGDVRGKVLQADATLRQREADLADLRAGVHYDVAAALLDVKSAESAVEVAKSGQDLAQQELDQAQDRFRAGLTSTIELVQAQDSLAKASDAYIASVYAQNVAKASLGRALGIGEDQFVNFIGGR